MKLFFGTAGAPMTSLVKDSVSGVKRVRELGLDCMELEFVRGVRMGAAKAEMVRREARRQEVHLSVHSPYYLNLNSRDMDKIKASLERIYQSARIGSMAGAKDVVFHAAFRHKNPPAEVYRRVKKELEELLERLAREDIRATLRPETTGRMSQFGTLEEVLELSCELEGVEPCVDFAHLHARKGGENTYEEFTAILDRVEETLGKEALKDMHMHVSGIEYGRKGEIRHLVLAESDFNYKDLLRALKDHGVDGALVCESPNLEVDAIIMRDHYLSMES